MSKILKQSLISAALLSQLNATEITLAPLEVTSTAIKTDELKATEAVEIYTQKDIEAAHVQNVYEFLNQQTSVTATPNFGNPFTQKLDIHGYGASNGHQNIVVTIDGRRMNNIDSSPQLLSSISPASVAKIEIIKSSGIVLAGDGANAAVINITTKKSNTKEISFYLGNYGLSDGSFYLGHKDNTLAISATGEAQKSDGIRDIDANGNKDKNKFSTGTFNLAYTPIEEIELRLGANFSYVDVIYAGSLTKAQYEQNPKQQGAYSTHQKFNTQTVSTGASYYINDELSINADIDYETKESEYVAFASLYEYDYLSYKINSEYNTDLFSFIVGVDGFDGTITKASSLDLEKKNLAGFLMAKFILQDFTLKAGYRYENIQFTNKLGAEKEDDNLHGVEAGVNYTLSKQSSLFFDYSHSYQYASLDSLFSFYTGIYSGYVDPSQADNFTLGYNNIQAKNKFKISAYYIDLKDEIYFDAFTYNNTNIDKSHKYGIDLYDKYIVSQEFNIALNYNYVQAIIDEEAGTSYAGNELPGVSNHNVKATFSYLPNQYATLSLTQEYRSEAYAANDFNNNFEQKQEAYYPTNISATYAKDNWEVFAKINNLFNQSNGLWIRNNAIYPVNFTTTGLVGFKLKY